MFYVVLFLGLATEREESAQGAAVTGMYLDLNSGETKQLIHKRMARIRWSTYGARTKDSPKGV